MYFINSILFIWSITIINSSIGLSLRGVAIENEPYVTIKSDGKYEGFCIDLLDEISKLAGFNYNLHLVPDGKYGVHLGNGVYDGMIGEIQRRGSDFAIGDITVTDDRSKAIDFTVPFMNVTLGIIILKSNNLNGTIKRLEDLAEQKDILYGFIGSGSTKESFERSANPKIHQMFVQTYYNPSVYTRSVEEGISKVKSTKYAFIGESQTLEFIADNDCDLEFISADHFPRSYAIALIKGSKYLNDFNEAIKQLIEEGTIDELKDKYWGKHCLAENEPNSFSQFKSSLCLIFILTFVCLILGSSFGSSFGS